MKQRNKKLSEWNLTRARFRITDRFPPKPLKKEKSIDAILSTIMQDEERERAPELPEELLSRWPIVCGKQIAKHTVPSHLKNGTLTVYADHHGWLTEVKRLPQSHLLKKLAKIPSLPTILRIRFQLDPDVKTWKNKT